MFHDGSFSLSTFDDRSWLFAIDTAYQDLPPAGRVFVRTVLESVYVQPLVEQIIAFADTQRVSVLSAADVLTASNGIGQRKLLAGAAEKAVVAMRKDAAALGVASNENAITIAAKNGSAIALAATENDVITTTKGA